MRPRAKAVVSNLLLVLLVAAYTLGSDVDVGDTVNAMPVNTLAVDAVVKEDVVPAVAVEPSHGELTKAIDDIVVGDTAIDTPVDTLVVVDVQEDVVPAAVAEEPTQPNLAELAKAVDKCRLLAVAGSELDGECAARTHQLSVRRRLAKFERVRSDALESLARERAACAEHTSNCEFQNLRLWAPIVPRTLVAPDSPFQEFFLHYSVDFRPAILPFSPLTTISGLTLTEPAFIESVVRPLQQVCGVSGCGLRNHSVPAGMHPDVHLDALSALTHLEALLLVPYFAINDYFQRLATVATDGPMSTAALNLAARSWPVVYSAAHVPLHTSPFGLHRVLIVLAGKLRVRVVNGEQTAFFYPRSDGTFPPEVDLFHPDLAAFPALQLVSGVESVVPAGHVLFVPSGSSVTWHAVDTTTEQPIDDTLPDSPQDTSVFPVVVELCFVDASNLNRVKAELAIAGLQSAKLATLRAMLQSTALDTSIDRKSQTISLLEFYKWPRAPSKPAEPADSLAAGQDDCGDSAACAGKTKSQKLASKSRTSRANRLKDWQEDRKWGLRIRQLAMPAPSTPLIHAVGRRNATVLWHCPNEGVAHTHGGGETHTIGEGAPIIGYSLVWHAQSMGPEIRTDEAGTLAHTTSDSLRLRLGMGVPAHNHTADEVFDEMDMSKHSLLDFDVSSGAEYLLGAQGSPLLVGCGGVSADVLCVTVPNLQPNHVYVFRVAAITEIGKSTFSESSPTARTGYLQVPSTPPNITATAIGVATVRIQTVLPLDDGGLPLLGCVVLRQENWLGDYGEATLTLLPRTGDRTIDLIGLVPATGYRFKVAFVNAAGMSAFSEPSNGVTTLTYSTEEAMAAVVGFGGVVTNANSFTREELQAMHVVATVFIRSSPADTTLSVEALLDRSGFGRSTPGSMQAISGADSMSKAALNSGASLAGAFDSLLPPSASRSLIMVPCLGPVVTLSDTKQSLIIHTRTDTKYIAWAGHYCPRKYDVKAEIVASKPLSGLKPTNLNEFHRRVVYFERGETSLRDKVRLAAQNGALGVVIGDNTGRCTNHEFSQVCVPGGDKRRNEGFARTDSPQLWQEARIPAIVIEQQDALLLKQYIL